MPDHSCMLADSEGVSQMHKGDIDNKVTPRLLLVFEGALGNLPKESERSHKRAMKRGNWAKAVSLWKLNQELILRMWYVYRTLDKQIEIVSYLPEEFVEELALRLDQEAVPSSRVWASQPFLVARLTSFQPDISHIYDADPSRVFTYGSKGRILSNPNDFGR